MSKAHYHNKIYQALGGNNNPHVVATSTAILIAAGVAAAGAGATIGTNMYQAGEEKKQQNKLLERQDQLAREAEAKVAGAQALAEQASADKLRKQRLGQTQTILTSPLGIQEQANINLPVLLGGK